MLARRPVSEPPPPASSDAASGSLPTASGLSGLEARLAQGDRQLLVVTAPRGALEAIAAHVERRLSLAGCRVVRATSGRGGEGFRLALAQLRGRSSETLSARDAAAELVARTSSPLAPQRLVVVEPSTSRYARAVASELNAAVSAGTGPSIVWVTTPAEAEAPLDVSNVVEMTGALDPAEVEVWWAAAAASVLPQLRSIDALDAWWHDAQREQQPRRAPLGRAADLSRALSLVGRPWPETKLAELVAEADRSVALALGSELVSLGVVDVREHGAARALVAIGATQGEVGPEIVVRAVSALTKVYADDAWALFRAAELCFSVGDLERGDALAQRAITEVVDGDARADFWARLLGPGVMGAASATRSLGYVSLGLLTGDVDIALRFARDAASLDPESADVLLALGKCHAAMGDTPAALVTMQRAAELTSSPSLRARVDVELAEVRYRSGDLAAASAAAQAALTRLADTGTRSAEVLLDARNVLGKVLLARASFAEAELHFTADACEASLAKLLVAELRARVNRAISVLYLGRRAEAQALLEVALTDAERHGEAASGHALVLVNLAVIATLDHRYADALDFTERATKAVLRVGERSAFARCTANLADLRLRLGLVTEAEQALRFGARGLKGALPGFQAAQFSITQARVHLERGDTTLAQQAVLQGLSEVGASIASRKDTSRTDGPARGPGREVVSQAFRVAARIALEDGDTARARVLVDNADQEGGGARAMADLAVIRAMLSRALGEPFVDVAHRALEAAREADDIELLRESHMLLHHAALSAVDIPTARHHLQAALSYRDRVAADLPEALRVSFLSRRDIAALDHAMTAFVTFARAEAEAAPVTPAGLFSQSDRSAPRPATRAVGGRPHERGIVGEDLAVRALLKAIGKVGPSDATVLVHGESGTGKELVAEALHEASARRTGPLVKVNCAALVETLLLSELFGHEKGSFTGAASRRRGRFEAAEGGTLFLDEIGDISPRTQVALLRVLQEKTFERVGGTTPIRANVRVVCATHRNLKALVARGEFREDLYYRLAGVVLEVPALRSRLGDLGPISEAILTRIALERGGPVKMLSSRCLTALKTYPWPGNVRELENALRAASLFADADVLEPEDFADNVDALRSLDCSIDTLRTPSADPAPAASQPGSAPSALESFPRGMSLAAPESVAGRSSIPAPNPSEVAYAQVRSGTSLHDMKRIIERECIARALGDAGGNITRAAALLGMKRPRLSQLVKQYGLGSGAAEGDCDDGDEVSEEES